MTKGTVAWITNRYTN